MILPLRQILSTRGDWLPSQEEESRDVAVLVVLYVPLQHLKAVQLRCSLTSYCGHIPVAAHTSLIQNPYRLPAPTVHALPSQTGYCGVSWCFNQVSYVPNRCLMFHTGVSAGCESHLQPLLATS